MLIQTKRRCRHSAETDCIILDLELRRSSDHAEPFGDECPLNFLQRFPGHLAQPVFHPNYNAKSPPETTLCARTGTSTVWLHSGCTGAAGIEWIRFLASSLCIIGQNPRSLFILLHVVRPSPTLESAPWHNHMMSATGQTSSQRLYWSIF